MTAAGGGSRVKGTPGTRCEEATGRDARAGRRPPLVCLGDSSLFWMGCNGQRTKAADVTTTCLYKCLRRTAQGRITCMFEREGWKRGGWSKRRRGRNGTTCCLFVIDTIPPLQRFSWTTVRPILLLLVLHIYWSCRTLC